MPMPCDANNVFEYSKRLMDTLIRFLSDTPTPILAALFLLENAFIFCIALAGGEWLARRYVHQPATERLVAERPPAVTRTEMVLALVTVLLNALVTLGGLYMWRSGIIQFRTQIGWAALFDFLFLVLVMDFAMYVLHRLAHVPWIFRLIHRTHHVYDNPRPLTLFVMNPLEALSFGLMWLALLSCYDATWLGMSFYLVFNVAFGTIGHIGVEPVSARWRRHPVLRHISTSSFHAGHHQSDNYNFGFYTLLWDRLFGTLSPDCARDSALMKTTHSIAP